MQVYRIAKCRFVDDLAGRGAALYGGRWNSKDTHLLYTAATPALALLESVAHLGGIVAEDYCMITLELPAAKSIHTITSDNLPPGWNGHPPMPTTRAIGDAFVKAGSHLALHLPSAILEEEWNVLINPRHKAFGEVKVVARRKIEIDSRLVHVG